MLKALKDDDPILREVCAPVSLKELRNKKTQKIIEQLLDYMQNHSNKGKVRDRKKSSTVGLSLNQVGISKSICIVDLGIGHKSYNDLFCLVNPQIIKHSKIFFDHLEGCVNLPEVYGIVPRYRWVRVKAWDRSGHQLTLIAKGWLSVLLQHEIGHLNGRLFIDHLKDPKKALFVKMKEQGDNFRKNYKNWDQFIDVSGWLKK